MEEQTLQVAVTITPEMAQAMVQTLREAMQAIAQAIRQALDRLAAWIRERLGQFGDWWHALLRRTDPRLYHLAFHAKRTRARKKNMRRLLRKLAGDIAQGAEATA